ncbi:hypothetical protein NQ315_000665 [Exocentrus adspersus]|uniref:DUF4806 domain-containing protein n=1 Tax=Exocentrus adspersus TaxID=1586481 RepID=A0AAV8VP09_9CUCU|nr:hypothetical protein NQ315_000665 [Exocentrus adspersus]
MDASLAKRKLFNKFSQRFKRLKQSKRTNKPISDTSEIPFCHASTSRASTLDGFAEGSSGSSTSSTLHGQSHDTPQPFVFHQSDDSSDTDSSTLPPRNCDNLISPDPENSTKDPQWQPDNNQETAEVPALALSLTTWALKHNISQLALSDLLDILRKQNPELPEDARTLLKTPRNTGSLIKVIEPGVYYHFGLSSCLESLVTEFLKVSIPDSTVLEICVNIDGLPLSKSSGYQICGIYEGHEKPKSCNDFMSDFVQDIVELIDNGFLYNGTKYTVKIVAFICDVPAKSFLKCVKGHSGYMSCTKCDIEGIYVGNRICFPSLEGFHLRTDSSFRTKEQESHHMETTILENIPGLDMIKSFPLDYMHLVCLGVMKKLLNNLWQTKNISDKCLELKNEIPKEILRRPRSLSEVKRWKATEFCLFLFYMGPVVLKQNVPDEIFMQLLKHFVKRFSLLYGEENVSHNIHNLLHLTDDVINFGSIEMFSAFPFENKMMFIKKLIRKGDKPLQQIINRISEMKENSSSETQIPTYPILKVEHSRGPLITNSLGIKQYERICFNTFLLFLHDADSCCVLDDNSIVIIKNIISHNQHIKIIGQKFLSLENYYTSPCESSKLNIFLVSNLNTELESWDVNSINYKCIKLITSRDTDEHFRRTMSSPAKTWTVVCFTTDDSVEAVPTRWINGDDCLWPAVTRDKLNSLIRKCEFNSCWPTYKVRTFRNATYDEYATARSKASKAENTSDLNTTDIHADDPFKKPNELGKRARKKKILSSSDSSEDDEPLGVVAKKKRPAIKKIPAPPAWIDETRDASEDIEIIIENYNQKDLQSQPNSSSALSTNPNKPLHFINENLKNIEKTRKTKAGCCCNPELLYNIQSLLVEINRKIDKKCDFEKQQKREVPTNILEKSKVSFPMETTDQLTTFEKFLSVTENYSALVLLFTNFGGINLYEFVRRCIAPIISDSLCQQFSFLGKKGKTSFKTTYISKAVIEAAQKSGHSNNYKDTELRIGDWLRRAKERRLRFEQKNK